MSQFFRAYHGMLWHKGYIYIIGGFDGNHCFNDMRRYDPVSHAWEEKACMYQQRCYVSVATLDNYMYAMGGFDGNRRNKTCERYNPEGNEWKMMASMNQVRSDASADALNGKNGIFISALTLSSTALSQSGLILVT